MKLSPEQLLLRWVNHQLKKVKYFLRSSFSQTDIVHNLQINLLLFSCISTDEMPKKGKIVFNLNYESIVKFTLNF